MYPLQFLKLKALRLKVKSNFNSFRIQTDIRYQRTFHVPAKTTLIGLLVAAFGLDETEVEHLYALIQANAILQRYSRTANDLWSTLELLLFHSKNIRL
jgi:CRISPR-associated Cas5-like protein